MIPVGRRYHLLAFVVDMVFPGLLFFLTHLSYGLINAFRTNIVGLPNLDYDKMSFLFILLALGITEAFTGVTPGKLCTSIHPVTKKGIKGSVGFYLLRFFLRYLPLWITILANMYFDDYAGILFVIGALINLGCLLVHSTMLHEIIVGSVTVFKKDIQQP